MHELSLCEAIAGVVKTHADGRHVDVVRVRIGALRQVVPDSLSFCWTLVRDSEDMPDAELELECVSAEVRCRACGRQSDPVMVPGLLEMVRRIQGLQRGPIYKMLTPWLTNGARGRKSVAW